MQLQLLLQLLLLPSGKLTKYQTLRLSLLGKHRSSFSLRVRHVERSLASETFVEHVQRLPQHSAPHRVQAHTRCSSIAEVHEGQLISAPHRVGAKQRAHLAVALLTAVAAGQREVTAPAPK